ncbi:MAG TPA: hypothetical protein VGD98_10525 [Ktedonobacteraceae bacterium]
MQLADLTIDQPQQQTQQLMRVYESLFLVDDVFVSAESQFEKDGLALAEGGWQLKQVSHRGTIVSPRATVVAVYEQ